LFERVKKRLARVLMHLLTVQIEGTAEAVLRKFNLLERRLQVVDTFSNMEVLPSAFASNDAHRVDKVAPCGGCLRASAVGGLSCVGSQMACVGSFCDA
jgi:hypothetical protein